ncbi:hypothetical protein DIPPA_10880 [Diplonema papillatum]|nr:hypothetical protein DIPPA_10880 [Diplonema papillatum]
MHGVEDSTGEQEEQTWVCEGCYEVSKRKLVLLKGQPRLQRQSQDALHHQGPIGVRRIVFAASAPRLMLATPFLVT